MKCGWVYILSNESNRVLYTGVTSDLLSRIQEHKKLTGSDFTSKYKVTKLVFVQRFATIMEAIEMEKKIKGGSRQKKIKLIESINSRWLDLSAEIASLSSQ